jgi:pimeloyl-ACP methyl ester carboxylesterase
VSNELTIPIGKMDWVWARLDRVLASPGGALPPLVLMVHGFPGDSRSYGDIFGGLSEILTEDGFHTLRFDMRGCGQSDKGARFFTVKTAHEDCLCAVRWAIKQGYEEFIIIAEGYGATIALTALIDTVRPRVKGVAFLWPILERRGSWLSTLVPLGEAAEERGEKSVLVENVDIGLEFIRELRDYNLIPLLKRLEMRTQIYHGTVDDKSDMDAIRTLLGRVKPKGPVEIVGYEGGGHGLKEPEHRQVLIRQITDFIRKL